MIAMKRDDVILGCLNLGKQDPYRAIHLYSL